MSRPKPRTTASSSPSRVRYSVLAGVLTIAAFGCLTATLAAIRHRQPPVQQPAVQTADIPPETYQETISLKEERREATDFLLSPAELLQASLRNDEVLGYNGN